MNPSFITLSFSLHSFFWEVTLFVIVLFPYIIKILSCYFQDFLYFSFLVVNFFLARPHGMWDLSSLTKDQTLPPALVSPSLNH